MARLLRKRFDLDPVTTSGQVVREEFNLDKDSSRVAGILVTATRDDQLYHRGTISVLVSGEEVIPEQYHAKLLMSGLGVAPKDRYLPLDVAPGNGVVKVAYTDNPNPALAFAAYNVSIYLEIVTDEGD